MFLIHLRMHILLLLDRMYSMSARSIWVLVTIDYINAIGKNEAESNCSACN